MSESIQWLEWADAPFTQAGAANLPVLLWLVTAWSEECRAMDRTTFADPAVIAEVSSQFVPIRVDADRRPDVNERYNLGGWPTVAFLTSDGNLLSGGTYLDAEQMLGLCRQVATAWRERGSDIRARAAETSATRAIAYDKSSQPDSRASAHLRSLLIDRFDAIHGGFGTAPKVPHAPALLLALSLASDDGDDANAELAAIVEMTLEKMSALWDPKAGGFYRYADAADWSLPGAEKTLEDNAALLHVYIEASLRRGSEDCRARAGSLVRWVKAELADERNGGFYNATSSASVDRAIYVDRNAQMIGAFLRAAAMFEDPWLRDFALKSLEAVVLPGYSPGKGAAHTIDAAPVRGLLTDQVHASSAAIWAHAVTEQLPYSMLAAELMEFAIRTMWDESGNAFRDRMSTVDPLHPFQLNCDAACVLDRLATLTGDPAYHERALAILRTLAGEYLRHDLFGASYALAVREVVDRRPPVDLALAKVDWYLEPPTS
jgi:uncharacterized protein YyaL (SSP411 family)